MFSTYQNKTWLIFFGLAWFMMMVFSHEYYSQKVNQANQQQLTKTQQLDWHLTWSLDSKSAIVSSFESDWQVVGHAVTSSEKNPELSLDMQGKVIDPTIHQSLLVQGEISQEAPANGRFKLEFSDQRNQIYYVSEDLSIKLLNQDLDLSSLRWQVIKPGVSSSNESYAIWSNIAFLDALVMRFYFTAPSSLVLNGIQIKQTQAKKWTVDSPINCQQLHLPAARCWVSNQMRHFNLQQNLILNNQLLVQSRVSPLPVWSWFWLSVGLMTLLFLLRANKSLTTVLITLAVFVAIALVHQDWVATNFSLLRWPLLALLLILLWQNKHWLALPEHPAAPVWLISLSLSMVLLLGLATRPVGLELLFDFPQYLLWACVQQLLLGPVVSRLLFKQLNMPKGMIAVVVGVLFSIIHAPNHVLMAATLLAGMAWSYAWLKYENLYANAFSHALLALVFYQIMPEAWLGSARIGVFF
ncbi:CPBP family intramembrane glutamic endopeptidase [Marinicella litoralis]|uniref:CPBP family intramembrane glutamic endopeptidase n=1 Tax=Marinicella litoralis TaxID=644220 RepID=UPI0015D5120F|nr:CPBP family intramembrane glutamic endopeptidase [Marinicella litoralis]